jgi:chromatin assembly factor 1 subunit B
MIALRTWLGKCPAICRLSFFPILTSSIRSHDGHVLMLASSDGYCTVVVFDENMPLYHTQQRDLQLKSVALAHSHPLISPHPHGHGPTPSTGGSSNSHVYQPQTPNASSTHAGNPSSTQSPLVHPPPSPFVPPYAQSPAVSIKDLPGPSGSGSGSGSAGFGGPGTLKRTASSFDVPLTPAASVGGDGDAFMATSGGGSESDRERERAEEGPAKKRRRVELRHHGVA